MKVKLLTDIKKLGYDDMHRQMLRLELSVKTFQAMAMTARADADFTSIHYSLLEGWAVRLEEELMKYRLHLEEVEHGG